MEHGNLKIVKLSGGLGNQLFQYFFGKYLVEQFSCKVKYFNECGLLRLPAFDKLHLGIEYCTEEDLVNCHYHFDSRLQYRIKRKAYQLAPWLNKHVLVETGSKYQAHISQQINVFDGYWQSYKYLLPQSVNITSDLELCHSQEINASNAVFVHLRRGDYLNKANKGLFSICSKEYFEESIKKMMKQLAHPVFFIFSNDIDWARRNLCVPNANLKFVSNEGAKADLIDFFEMARCKHAIISNSTFSWWAAWLIANKEKKVIAPLQWYKNPSMNDATIDLIPPSWERI